MNFSSLQPYIGSLVRHGASIAAGALVSHGLLTQAQTGQFTECATGIGVGLITLAWSWWQKNRQGKKLIEAVNTVAPTIPVATVAAATDVIKN